MMRKKSKIAAIFTGTLLLTLVFSAQTFAFTGWVEEDENIMYFLDRNGERVTDTWMKRGDERCYLDENGLVARNQFIDYDGRDCYVNETGALAKNYWVSTLNLDNECDQEVDFLWYYFDNKGNMAKGNTKPWKINASTKPEGQYFFDEHGHMLSGWLDITDSDGNENTYYLGEGDDGKMVTEWRKLAPREETYPENSSREYDEEVHYYFDYQGKQIKDQEKKIKTHYYQFDANGVLITGWYPGVFPSDPDFAVNTYYDKETGARSQGWIYAYEQDDYEESENKYWYYLDKKGHVFNEGGSEEKDGYAVIAIKQINNRYYGFDARGRMITGLVDTREDASEENQDLIQDEFKDVKGQVIRSKQLCNPGIYYFEADDEHSLGQLHTGKHKLDTDEGVVQFYFGSRGEAYVSCMADGYIYDDGGRMLRGDGLTEVMSVPFDIYRKGAEEEDAPIIPYGCEFIVTKAGKVKKNGTTTIDGIKYKTENYIVVDTD